MMRIDIATLFPDMCEAFLGESIIGRARNAKLIDIRCHQIRDWAFDKHRRVDDSPYGGGKGMVMMCEPIYLCYRSVCEQSGSKPHVIYMSPKGKVFDQSIAKRLSDMEHIFILCGHYEGVDERILEEIVDEEISLGDFVLTGGEIPAVAIADAVGRLCPGVLAADECFENESHYSGLLEHPQYTRPEEWHGKKVPEVLLSGNHKLIAEYRLQKSLEITKERRPDMLDRT